MEHLRILFWQQFLLFGFFFCHKKPNALISAQAAPVYNFCICKGQFFLAVNYKSRQAYLPLWVVIVFVTLPRGKGRGSGPVCDDDNDNDGMVTQINCSLVVGALNIKKIWWTKRATSHDCNKWHRISHDQFCRTFVLRIHTARYIKKGTLIKGELSSQQIWAPVRRCLEFYQTT